LEQARPGSNLGDEGNSGAVTVTGGGTNVYGRFQLRGYFHPATRALVCRRAYVQLPRKKKRRRGGAAVDPALDGGRTSQRIKESDDAAPGQRRRRAPSKFDGSDDDQVTDKAAMLSIGGTRGGGSDGKIARPKTHRSRCVSLAYHSDSDVEGGQKHSGRGLTEGSEEYAEEAEEEDPFEEWDHLAAKEPVVEEERNCEEWREAFVDDEANEVYEGEVAGEFSEREGHGVCVYLGADNAMYEGEWLSGREHGRGVLMTATREVVYDGEVGGCSGLVPGSVCLCVCVCVCVSVCL